MRAYNNHHQIYTHSTTHGVIIGQYWKYPIKNTDYFTYGRVQCITEDGSVVIESRHRQKISINKFCLIGTLIYPVVLKPFKQTDGSVRIQAIAMDRDEHWVFGELRRNYGEKII